ncbi:endonuclease III [Leadbettera azotonutricia]|nr:endonuclease III [Leadbettera azotonutricia]
MSTETLPDKKARLQMVMKTLGPLYPDHRPLLDFETPFQLLVSTVLAAQCTDAAVNIVTRELFSRFPDPAALAEAPLPELEKIVHSTGFFRAKAHNIKALSRQLLEKHSGEVPDTMEGLTALPGAGRKTASVVLSTCFGIPAIIVDTHFSRVTKRLGFTHSDRPEEIEKHLAAITPRDEWIAVSHVLNRFGRNTCYARKPDCENCPVKRLCPESAV